MEAADQRGRRSHRLPDYDYSSSGAYFVTLCVQSRECVLGRVIGEQVALSDCGAIVAESWRWLVEWYPYVTLDAWVVMPNHFHGILWLDTPARSGASRGASPFGSTRRSASGGASGVLVKPKPLGSLIGAFKTVSAKQINLARGTLGSVFWQRNYWEHVIRDDEDLRRIREYIQNNPLKWAVDRLYREA